MAKLVAPSSIKGNERVILFSQDGGETYSGLTLGSLMGRELVENKVPAALEACGARPDQARVLGSTCIGSADTVSGVIGIDFHPPLSLNDAAVFAATLTAKTHARSIEFCSMNQETGSAYAAKSLGQIILLQPRPKRRE